MLPALFREVVMSATTFGKYELLTKLAAGGMAVTYRARMFGAKGVQKPVVLKLIHPHLAEEPDFVEMFISEARLSATLSHSNIAQVFDFGEVEGRYFIAMELVDGQSLSQVLKRMKQKGYQVLPVPIAILIAIEMCEALYYAHNRNDEAGAPMNLVHRDVSPENVLLSYNGEVKLVDFGIAKSTLDAKQTATGMVKGKYPYFSPEQSRADRTMDARTDIYAASVCLYEMVCARRPYEGEFVDVMRQLLTGDYPLPSSLNPEVPRELEQLLLKGLALDRNARFKTAREMGQMLGQVLHTLYPDVARSDLQSLLAVIYEDEMKAAGRQIEIRPGFRELMAGRPALATDAALGDKTPPEGTPALMGGEPLGTGKRRQISSAKHKALGSPPRPSSQTRIKPSTGKVQATSFQDVPPEMTEYVDSINNPTAIRTTGNQQEQMTLDTPELAQRRNFYVKLATGGIGVLVLAIAIIAAIRSNKTEEDPLEVKTPVWATSLPSGATVSVNGKPVGTAPMDGYLLPGQYTFGMTLQGFRPWTRRMSVSGNRQVHVEAQLVPEDGDEPGEIVVPTLPSNNVPITQEGDGGAAPTEMDADIKHKAHWPLRSFSIWPREHSLGLKKYTPFEYQLEPGTAYQVSISGSVDLGRQGRTSVLMYYLEGDKVDEKERWGFLGPGGKTVRNATKIYAWAFDDDASDNSGRIALTFRISKYIPERSASFDATENVIVPSQEDLFSLDGLLADHTYSMVFRPDAPRVSGKEPAFVLCLQKSPRPRPMQKRYTFYPLKFIGNLTGVTGLDCMFIAAEAADRSGVLEVDIDDLADLKREREEKK